MDKNKIVMWILLGCLFYAYLLINTPKKEKIVDKIEKSQQKFTNEDDTDLNTNEKNVNNNIFAKFTNGIETEHILENNLIKVLLSNKGGTIKEVTLKNELDYKDNPIKMIDKQSTTINYEFYSEGNKVYNNDLYFSINSSLSNKKVIYYEIQLSDSKKLRHIYTIQDDSYCVEHTLQFIGANEYIDNKKIIYHIHDKIKRQEHDYEYCKNKTTINFLDIDGRFDSFDESLNTNQHKSCDKPLKWIAIRQRFFTLGISDENNEFLKALINLNQSNDNEYLKEADIRFELLKHNTSNVNDYINNIKYYFGPNKYENLKNFNNDFEKNLYIGAPIIKHVNKYFIIPMLDFLTDNISNVILVLLILSIFIRIILFPLFFKSYISTEKMKIISPMLLELNEKYKNDPQKAKIEQINLYRTMGVNPLSGCLPMLLQTPLFIALFSIIPNYFNFRNQNFLWIKDISSFDSIYTLSFSIPFYGNHISLLAILMVISTIGYMLMSSNDNLNQQSSSKYIPYLFSFLFLFIMNSMPASLNLYYLFSNILTILQRSIISKFVNKQDLMNKMNSNKKIVSNISFTEQIDKILTDKNKS